ncbi:Tetratricopeptide repeat superfamily protein [Perilla frutescens var. hirtella]|nr:Tetratricopeptide repeat superfamily protein [Perilla frutescens var. hirtella]
MSSSSCVDHHNSDICSQPRSFLTPPPTWKTDRRSPVMPRSEMKPQPRGDLFHIVHKIPSGDSPYVRAKHVQLVDKDPSRAISLFWAAINAGDRVDSALKDMAVVMKQLNRSDEAIEAIKSFRHLSPPESQESLDNILVELYKQSGRLEEEVELLQHKLKQVEEGMAFAGRKTKMARSQGKKIQITVQKEYSRLLGNLAWAYMQQNDFKSAEEYYRKALSFEPDKNKQCNLAVCLMHMNKLTEAKFLLQAISSGNGAVDDSYAKSYERASEILAEFESQHVHKPIKQMEQNNESGMARGFVHGHLNKTKSFGGQWGSSKFCSQKHSDGGNAMLLSPLPSSTKMNSGAFTDFAYEKRADFDWRTNHYEPNVSREGVHSSIKRASNIPKVPLTQPRRCLRSGDHRKAGLVEHAHGSYSRKLSFESSTSSDTVHSFASQTVNYYSYDAPDEMPKILPQFLEKKMFPSIGRDNRRILSVKPLEDSEEGMKSLSYDCKNCGAEESAFSADSRKVEEISDKNFQAGCGRCEHKKSWADMVEEDEVEFGNWKNDYPMVSLGYPSQKSSFSDEFSAASMNEEGFDDENVDSNIIPETPKLHDLAEKASRDMGSIDLGSGYLTQPDKKAINQPIRRSLCFDQNHIPLTTKVLNFEGKAGGMSDELSSSSTPINRRRLQVFQDITRVHGTPTASLRSS